MQNLALQLATLVGGTLLFSCSVTAEGLNPPEPKDDGGAHPPDTSPDQKTDDGSPVTSTTRAALPICDETIDGALFYLSDESVFVTCTVGTYAELDLTGPPGADGQDGAPGADGQDGAPGADGQDGQDGAPGGSLQFDGSRLEHVAITTPGGLTYYTGELYDTDLDVFCDFALTQEDLLRCLPSGEDKAITRYRPGDTAEDGLFYTDAACTNPVYAFPSPYGTPEHSGLALQGSVGIYFLSIDAPLSAPSPLYEIGSGDLCSSWSGSTDAWDFYAVSEVDLSIYAVGTLSHAP